MAERLELILPYRAGNPRQTLEVDFDDEQTIDGHFRRRYGRTRLGEHVIQRIAHTGGDDEALRLLRREVNTGRRLHGALRSKGYPEYLSKLVGYNPDDALPYSVFTSRPGSLADLDERPLDPETWRTIARQLLIAMRALEYAQIVHRRIRPENVRWDGTFVQLADFTHAIAENGPREPYGEPPWDPPEQLRGDGVADIRDDVYAFGMLMVHLITGAPLPDDASVVEQLGWQDMTDRRFLRGTRAPLAKSRPTPDELFGRLPPGEDSLNPLVRTNLGIERKARRSFRKLRERQYTYWREHPRPVLITPSPARSTSEAPPPASAATPETRARRPVVPPPERGEPRTRLSWPRRPHEPASREPGATDFRPYESTLMNSAPDEPTPVAPRPAERRPFERGPVEPLTVDPLTVGPLPVEHRPVEHGAGSEVPRGRPVPYARPLPDRFSRDDTEDLASPWWLKRYPLVLAGLLLVMAAGLVVIALGAVG